MRRATIAFLRSARFASMTAGLALTTLGLALSVSACSDSDGKTDADQNLTQAKPRIDAFACKTDEPFYDGDVHEARFAVSALDDADGIDVVWPDGDDLAISTTPADSPLAALNENLSIRRDDGTMVISGDSDGFFLSLIHI